VELARETGVYYGRSLLMDPLVRYMQRELLELANKRLPLWDQFQSPPPAPPGLWSRICGRWNRRVRWPFNRARHRLGGHCEWPECPRDDY